MRTFTCILACLAALQAGAVESKVNDKIPLAHFSSTGDHRFSYQDVLLVQIYRQNPNLPESITNAPRHELIGTDKFWGPLVKHAETAADQIIKGAGQPPYPASIFAPKDLQASQAFMVPDFLSPLRVRKTWQQLSMDDPDQADAAKVSLERDFIKGDSVWTAHGAVGWDFSKARSGTNRLDLTGLHFVPNVAFDRVTGKKPIDSLEFRLPLELEFAYATLPDSSSPLVESHWIRITPLHATDFSFRSQQIGGEFEWEPLGERIWLGGYREIPAFGLQFNLHAFLHVEGGSVLDSGSNTNLVEGNGFFRGGPNIALKIRPADYHKLVLKASWIEYEKFAFVNRSTRLFSTGLSWELAKGLSVEFEYRKGRIPITAEKVDGITLGIGLKL